jgi:hypothetical protein
VRDIQRQIVQPPLLGCHRVIRVIHVIRAIRVPEEGSGVLLTPFTCGGVCSYMERGAEGDIVGNLSWTVVEIVGGDGIWGWEGDQ